MPLRTYRKRTNRRRYNLRRRPKRTYKKRTSGRRYVKKRSYAMVSRRALLNVTSTKKKDTMLSVNGPIADGIQTLGPTRVVPFASGLGEPNTYLWVASAREPVQSSPSNPAFPADRPTRSRTTCFARMLTEKVELQTQSSKPWTWRRIVFEVKGVELLNYGVGFASGYSLTGIGYARLVGAPSLAIIPFAFNPSRTSIFPSWRKPVLTTFWIATLF